MIDAITSLVDSLAWPLAIVWLGYVFRSEIRALLGRVSQLKYKDLEAQFEKELSAVEADAREALPVTQQRALDDEAPTYPPPYDERYSQLLRIAEASPRAALLEAWFEVEAAVAEAAERFQIPVFKGYRPSRKNVIDLIKTGRYDKSVLQVFEDMRQLRNEAAHVPEFQPTGRQIRRYIEVVIDLALTFRNPLLDEPE